MPNYDDSFLIDCDRLERKGLRSYNPHKRRLRFLSKKAGSQQIVRRSLCDIIEQCEFCPF